MSGKIHIVMIKEFVSKNQDNTFTTKARKKKFTAAITDGRLAITPQSSGKTRKESDKVLLSILDHFNKTRSLQPKDYQDVTFNSVYVLTLIEESQKRSLEK